jgi:hypothetical protein
VQIDNDTQHVLGLAAPRSLLKYPNTNIHGPLPAVCCSTLIFLLSQLDNCILPSSEEAKGDGLKRMLELRLLISLQGVFKSDSFIRAFCGFIKLQLWLFGCHFQSTNLVSKENVRIS